MARPDPRKTKDEAADHVARGRWRKALDCYRILEKLEPSDGTWPQRIGEMHRRLGQNADAADALTRACDIYSQVGFLLKAIAVCKLILDIDPRRADVEARLANLHSARFATQRRAGLMTAVPLEVSAPEPPPPDPPALPPPLAQIPLARVVPGSRPSDQIPSRVGSAVYEIPLEVEDIEVVAEMEAERPSAAETARDLFPRTPLFSALDEGRLRLLIQRVELRRLAAGEVLFRRGDPAEALFVIAAGEVAVLQPGPDGVDAEINRLFDGAFFGEIGLLTDHPRTATITAAAETDLLVIDRATVAAITTQAPAVLQLLLRFMRDRLVASLVANHPLFTPFGADEGRALAARFLFLEAEGGSHILVQGVRAPGLFVILAGDVDILHDGRPVATLTSGAILGEASLFSGAPAPATARAREKVFLLSLPRGDVQEVIMTHPQVLEHLGTLAENNERQLELWKQV